MDNLDEYMLAPQADVVRKQAAIMGIEPMVFFRLYEPYENGIYIHTTAVLDAMCIGLSFLSETR